MRTLDLNGAAEWLKCDPETVRAMAAACEIPAAKVGRSWVFVDVDLVDWLRSRYSAAAKTTKSPAIGTPRAASKTLPAYEEALGLPTRQKPRAIRTTSKE